MQINEFYNVTEIGHGGMGTVYVGYSGERKVAIKEIRRDYMSETELIERFRLEANLIKRCHHPSIVKIVEPAYYNSRTYYPAFEENGNLYLAMEFVPGDTIDRCVKNRRSRLPEAEAVDLMCKILEPMEYIRQQGLIHRDIKPSNIIVRPDKSVCIIDFGIAKDMHSNGLTSGRCKMGTDGYISPEQAQGLTVDHRTDIYSLGCVLFYMLTGEHAIRQRESDFETRMAIIRDDFPRAKALNPQLSDAIQTILDKAVDKDMRRRFQSPLEFKRELERQGATIVSEMQYDGNQCVSVGRDSSCDIPIYDSSGRISRHHLDIVCEPISGKDCRYRIIDRSTNGTTVNGQKILKSEIHIDGLYRPCVSSDFIPTIILAGVVHLDWEEVVEAFETKQIKKEQKGLESHDEQPQWLDGEDIIEELYPPRNSIHLPEDTLSPGYGILSFLCPLVGWVLYFQWKAATPIRAKQVLVLAWIGFIVGLIINLILF